MIMVCLVMFYIKVLPHFNYNDVDNLITHWGVIETLINNKKTN